MFQLLKTVVLLVGVLAVVVASCMRVLDSPAAAFFCSPLGSDSDIERGFVPFWITLWVFLVGYGFDVTKKFRWAVGWWFRYTALLVVGYSLVVGWTHDDDPTNPWCLSFWFHHGMLVFWLTLWVFLVDYGYYVSKKDNLAAVCFVCAVPLVVGYSLFVGWTTTEPRRTCGPCRSGSTTASWRSGLRCGFSWWATEAI